MIKSFKHSTVVNVLLVSILAVFIRLSYLPYGTLTSGDRAYRVWGAWRWLDDPKLITHGVWGPLHYYLIALSMTIVRDPVWPPVLMQIAFEAFTPMFLYLFVKAEFRSTRAAILVALSYALYPLAILNTLGLLTQPLFSFFIVLGLLFLSLSRRENGSWKHAVSAGLAVTLAGMLRYEGWMLIPFLAILLWNKPRLMVIFVACAMLHPIFWMIGNGIEYGDPLYSMNWASNWELHFMGRANLSLSYKLNLVPRFLFNLFRWMTPPIAAASLVGMGFSIAKRDRTVVWLTPFFGLLCLYVLAIVRGSLVPKFEYTASLAIFLLPYSAITFIKFGIDRFSATRSVLAAFALGVSVFAFSYPPFFHHFLKLSVNPLPKFRDQKKVVEFIIPALSDNLRNPEDGFISDFYGFATTPYVALMTRLHPDRIFRASGAPYGVKPQNHLIELLDFVKRYPKGVLLLHNGSRFSEYLGCCGSEQLRIADNYLIVHKVFSIPWQELSRPEWRATYEVKYPEIQIYRYKLASK